MSKRALIIDDDLNYVKSMEDLLSVNGYECKSNQNGANGFDQAEKEIPDLIILDVMMESSASGLETAKKLRDCEKTANIPVFLMSGIKKTQFLLSSFAPGETFPNVKQVFEKPVNPEKLLKALKKVA